MGPALRRAVLLPVILEFLAAAGVEGAYGIAVHRAAGVAEGSPFWVHATVVCTTLIGEEIKGDQEAERFMLIDEGGGRYPVDPSDPHGKIFRDGRVRSRDLWVRLWPEGDSRYSVLRVLSRRADGFFELYYFCQTCNIRSFVGGPCWCCQQEFEFRETPVPAESPDLPRISDRGLRTRLPTSPLRFVPVPRGGKTWWTTLTGIGKGTLRDAGPSGRSNGVPGSCN